MIYYCLECDAKCYSQFCDACESNPKFETQEHPGFVSQAEIQNEIDTENFWYEYDER